MKGCTLSIVSGKISLGSTVYTITGGSILLSKAGHTGDGFGTTSSGSFLISLAGLRGNSTSTRAGVIGLDLKTGTSEFLVQLISP